MEAFDIQLPYLAPTTDVSEWEEQNTILFASPTGESFDDPTLYDGLF